MIPIILALACLIQAAPLAAKEKAPTIYQIPLPPKPDFSAVDWLVGEWAGKTTDQRAPGEIHLSVSYQLDKRLILLRGETSLQATKTSPAMKESWLGVLTSDRGSGGFLLRAFSNTGFITRYRVTVEGPEIRINPEGGEQPPPGWLFRTVIKRTEPQEFVETVQAAPPNKSFFDYYTAKLNRAMAQEKAKVSPANASPTSPSPTNPPQPDTPPTNVPPTNAPPTPPQ
ncbi:MAG TPA: hypothetical protein VEO19_05410 [Terriglobia bacterium]|nr:hypothetical protein [Terriglobia bacterium]